LKYDKELLFFNMAIREELRRILRIVADLGQNNINTSISDNAIQKESGISPNEVQKLLNELDSLGMIKEILSPAGTRPSEVDFRLYNLTQRGLEGLAEE
jgi:hypothetical protein